VSPGPDPTTIPLTSAYWPATAAAGGIRETTIGSVLRDAAERAPDKTALIDGDPDSQGRLQWTYAELLTDAERAAKALLTRFTPGERVAVWAPNSPEWVVLEVAGAAIRPAGTELTGDRLAEELARYRRTRLAAEKVPVRRLVVGTGACSAWHGPASPAVAADERACPLTVWSQGQSPPLPLEADHGTGRRT